MTSTMLVFGEDDNDRRALEKIIIALLPGVSIQTKVLRRPVVLSRDAGRSGKRRSMAEDIASFWRAEKKKNAKVYVVAHRDCDAVEPAHEAEQIALENDLVSAGIDSPIAATPAWEMEAWLMLFPDAVSLARSCWRHLPHRGSVGYIQNAKEQLRRDLRPIDTVLRVRCPDYNESDCVQIADHIRSSGITLADTRRSASLARFYEKLRAVVAPEVELPAN